VTSRGAAILAPWIGAMLVAEAVGFSAAMGLGRGVYALAGGEPPGLAGVVFTVGLSAVAGVVEGACLGFGQWLVLRRVFGDVGPATWICATALGGALAWVLGMTAGMNGPDVRPAPAVVVGVLIVSGLALGAVLGGAQAWVLRGRGRVARRWLAANAVGWMLGLLCAYAGVAILGDGASAALTILVLATSGAAMALIPAIATGRALRRFAAEVHGLHADA
jgi:hypothetical protein